MTAKTPQVFNHNQFGDIRIIADHNNEPLFCLADVCKALDISNVGNVKQRLSEKGIHIADTLTNGGVQAMTFINEPNLYKCIFQSRKPDAERFQDWVCEEVLPAIRKTGSYTAPSAQTSTNPIVQQTEAQILFIEAVSRNLRINDAGRLGMYQGIAIQLNVSLPAYVQSKGVHKAAKDLLTQIGSDMSSRRFNLLLEEHGYIEKKTRASSKGGTKSFWSITLKGEHYGENCVSPNNPNETQPHWYEDRFRSLYEIVTNP